MIWFVGFDDAADGAFGVQFCHGGYVLVLVRIGNQRPRLLQRPTLESRDTEKH